MSKKYQFLFQSLSSQQSSEPLFMKEDSFLDDKTRTTTIECLDSGKNCPYQRAINELEEYSYPASIPCRKRQKEYIMSFVKNGVQSKGCGSTLFISGFPGVGKTICVRDTIQTFKKKYNKHHSFIDIHINAMKLIKPNNIYATILKQLTGLQMSSSCRVLPILNQVLSKGRFPYSLYNKDLTASQMRDIDKRITKTKILSIDEIDYLFTKDQDVLYNLFEWTQMKDSKIVLITISNTFTFPEKLQQKIISRIGSERLIFKTYTSEQIELILTERMKQLQIFERQGIRLISKKLATTSDIRKCLFILRESVTKFLQMKKEGETEDTLISMDIVLKKIKQLYDNPLVNSLKLLPEIQKTVLLRVIQVIKETGLSCWISELYIQIRLKKDKKALTKSSVVEEALMRLRELNIIKMSIQNRHKQQKMCSDKIIPLHVAEFKIQLNIDMVSLLKGIDVL